MFNKGDDLRELVLVKIRGGGGQFGQDVQDGLNESGGLVSEVLLEEGNDAGESSSRLDETRGVSSQGGQELETLFASSDGISVVLGGSSVSVVFVIQSLVGSIQVRLVFSNSLLFVGQVGGDFSLFLVQVSLFSFVTGQVVLSSINLSVNIGNLITAPSSLSLDFSIIVSFSGFELRFNGVQDVGDGI